MQQIVFRLLGPPEIFHQDQLVKIPRRRSRALLYYLVCTQAPQPRGRLLTLLCGDIDEESARHTFKTLLAEVRALLRSFDANIEWIISDGDQITLNPRAPLWLDTEIFEKVVAVTSHHLDHAIDLYRGSFLDGFFLKNAPDFENWVRSTRDHFHRLYLTALLRLAELYETEHQLEQAIRCTQTLITTDPLVEEAYARLMRLYWSTGNRVAAMHQYEHLCTILAQELSVKPLASTQALYEQIAHQSTWPASGQSVTPHLLLPAQRAFSRQFALPPHQQPISVQFIGCTAEIEWLQQHLIGAMSTYPLLFLQGEMGSGKTYLLYEMRKRICPSWLVLQGTCQEVEQEHPYHAVVEALRQGLVGEDLSQLDLPEVWLSQIAQLLPDLFHTSAFARGCAMLGPLLLADALVALFNSLALPQRPLLLILDDLHWADAATLGLLGHLARYVRRGSVFLLGAFCPSLAATRLEPLRRSVMRQDALAELTISLPRMPEDA